MAYRTLGRKVVVIAAVVTTSACEPEANVEHSAPIGNRSHQAVLRDSVGSLGLEHIFSIGSADGPPEYAFGSVAAIAPRADNGFYVCDAQEGQIRAYDSTGTFIRTIGRRGSGPGEYASCGSMLALGNELFVSDVGNARLVVFEHGSPRARTIRWSSGHQLVAAESPERLWTWESRAGRTSGEDAWNLAVLCDPAQTRLDSLELPSARREPGTASFVIATDDGDLSPSHDSVFAFLPRGGAVVAHADQYRLEVRGTRDSPPVLSRSLRPIPYRASERAEWDGFSAYYERVLRRRTLRVQDTKPLIRELRGDEVDRVWVRLADTSYRRESSVPSGSVRPRLTHGEQAVWDLFDLRDGDYIGQLRLPIASSISASQGDRVWLRSLASDGSLRVSAYTLVPKVSNRSPAP